MSQARILYLSHGGGPLPLLGDESHVEMVDTLQKIAAEIERPSAIVVVSAHWEADVPTITSAASPALFYDYYNFPDEAYRITYPCPGDPALADAIHTALEKKGFAPQLDGERGLDHGVFVPLKIMYPEADIPTLQVSLVSGLDPATHIRLGEALGEIDNKGLLVIGSGFSFHNLRQFSTRSPGGEDPGNVEFEEWLIETCSADMPEAERAGRLNNWDRAPAARYCHPREEHLLPLHACYGMAGRACRTYYTPNILHKQSSMYLW